MRRHGPLAHASFEMHRTALPFTWTRAGAMKDLTPQSLVLFAIFVLPGLTAMSVYRLMMPARAMDWAQSVLQGLFYSTANYVLLLPLVVFVQRDGYAQAHPLQYWGGVLFLVLVAPMCWPLLLARIFRSTRLMSNVRLPFPTIWDYVFVRRKRHFVLIRLNDGTFVGGYWGEGSQAGTHPNDGEIFISQAYTVDDKGNFLAPVPNSAGLHIRRDQYMYVEFFTADVTEPEEGGHAEILPLHKGWARRGRR